MVSNISLVTGSRGFLGEQLRKHRHEQVTSSLYLIKYCATFSESCEWYLRNSRISKASSSEMSRSEVKSLASVFHACLKIQRDKNL